MAVLLVVLLIGLGLGWGLWALGARVQTAAWTTLRLRVASPTPWAALDTAIQTALAAAGGGLVWRVAEPGTDYAVVVGLPAAHTQQLQAAMQDAGIDHHLARVRALHLPPAGRWWRVRPAQDGATAAWLADAVVTLAVVRADGRVVVWASHAAAASSWRRRPVLLPAAWHARIMPLLVGAGRLLRGTALPLLPDPATTRGMQIAPLTVPVLTLPSLTGATLPIGAATLPLGPGQAIALVGASVRTTAHLHQVLTAADAAGAGIIAWLTASAADAWLVQRPAEQREAVAVVDGRQWAASATLSLAVLDDAALADVLAAWAALGPHDPARAVLPAVIRQWRQRPQPCPTVLLALLMELPPTLCAELQLTGLDRQLLRMRWMTRLVPLMRQQVLGLLAEPALDLAAWRAAGGTLLVVQPDDAVACAALAAVLGAVIDATPSAGRVTVVVADAPLPLRDPEAVCLVTATVRGTAGWHWHWCVGGATPAATVPLAGAGIDRIAVACMAPETSLLLHPSGTPVGRVAMSAVDAATPLPQRDVLRPLLQVMQALARIRPAAGPLRPTLLTAVRDARPAVETRSFDLAHPTRTAPALPDTWTVDVQVDTVLPGLLRWLGDVFPGAGQLVATATGVQVQGLRLAEVAPETTPMLTLPGTTDGTVAAMPWSTLRHLVLCAPTEPVLAWTLEGLLTGWSADTALLCWLGTLPEALAPLCRTPHWDAAPDPAADLATQLRAVLAAQMVPDADSRHRVVVVHAPEIDLALARALVAALRRSTTAPLTLLLLTEAVPEALRGLVAALPIVTVADALPMLALPGQPVRMLHRIPDLDTRWMTALPPRQRGAPALPMPDPATFWHVAPENLAPSLYALNDAALLSAAGELPREAAGTVSRVRRPQPLPLTPETAAQVLRAVQAGNGQLTPRLIAPLFPDAVAPDWTWLAALAQRLPGILLPPPGGTGAYRLNPLYQQQPAVLQQALHAAWRGAEVPV